MDEKTVRVRDLLSSYYGLPATQNAPNSSPATPAVRQPRSISLDSMAFDGDRYLNQLLKGSRLHALLQKHVDLSTEIKVLDSDMQMLVYENYNKFISATDTIRMMKSNLDGIDSKVHTLRETIGERTRMGRDECLHSRFQGAAKLSSSQTLFKLQL